MSILIKGIEMPDYGYVCLKVFANGEVLMTKEHRGALVITGIKDKVGTAIPVPPHGRLIDADALDIYRREEQAWHDYEQNPDNEYLEGVKDGLHEAAKQLSVAPTIIPAEEAPAEDINVPGTYDLLYEEGGPDA